MNFGSKLQQLSNWHVLYILVTITIFSLFLSAGAHLRGGEINWWAWFDGAFQNFSTEMMGAIATFGLFELVVGSRNEKKSLIIQMGSKDAASAANAVALLRERQWLMDGSLKGANLSNANLSDVTLDNANLNEANLTIANLENSSLRNVNLQDANLQGANLQATVISKSNLSNAKLNQANFENAKITHTSLKGADLRGANLRGADLHNVSLEHANLYGVQCDGTTILPNGQAWTPNLNWSMFNAVVIADENAWQAYKQQHGLT